MAVGLSVPDAVGEADAEAVADGVSVTDVVPVADGVIEWLRVGVPSHSLKLELLDLFVPLAGEKFS